MLERGVPFGLFFLFDVSVDVVKDPLHIMNGLIDFVLLLMDFVLSTVTKLLGLIEKCLDRFSLFLGGEDIGL